MDGERTVQEIWDAVSAQLGDDAPTQEEVIRLLGQLHAADALLCDVPPDSLEVFRRHQQHERMLWKRRLLDAARAALPAVRSRTASCSARCPGWSRCSAGSASLLWLAVVGTGAVLAASHWTDLTEDITDRVLDPQNLVLLWFVYPVVKALHELGHAYATRKWGGEVHEIGIMLLVLTPVPYVDASVGMGLPGQAPAHGGRRRRHRGGAVPRRARAVRLARRRARRGARHRLQRDADLRRLDAAVQRQPAAALRRLLRAGRRDSRSPTSASAPTSISATCSSATCSASRDAESPAHSTGERVWMVLYGIASFIYRVFIMFVIIAVHRRQVLRHRRAARDLGGRDAGGDAGRARASRSCSTSPGPAAPARAGAVGPASLSRSPRPALLFLSAGAELDAHRGRDLGARGGAGARGRRRLRRAAAGAGRQRGACAASR